MRSFVKILAAIATTGVACAALSAESDPFKDPNAVICDGVDVRDPRVPPELARKCANVQSQQPSRPPQAPTPAGGPGACASCARSEDPFHDPWLSGTESGSESAPGKPRLNPSALDELEARIRALEGNSYFEVVSPATGRTIFLVGPKGARFYNEGGTPVAAIGTTNAGGYFTAISASGAEASIGISSGPSAGIRLLDGGRSRVELGIHKGPYSLRFPVGDGMLAGIGASRAGSGAVVVGTASDGVTEGSITIRDERAVVSMDKTPGRGGIAFAEAKIGGGLLDVGTAGGQSAVKMGHNKQRYGIVLAGPILGFPYVPRSGLPGSYFMGCASGEKPACLPEVAEK
jgi:hypothetical protein